MSFRVVEISSPKNAILQDIRQAAARGRPTEEGLFVAEGPHLAQELLASKWQLEKLILTTKALERWESYARQRSIEIIIVPERTLTRIAQTETSQGVIALARPRMAQWVDLLGDQGLIVVLDGLQDPGNAGTIIRSAEAFGAAGVALLRNSVHLSNGKLIRASAGSVFRVPVCEGFDADEFLSRAQAAHLRLLSLDSAGERRLADARFDSPCALIVGNEAHGISPELRGAVSETIAVKTHKVESLNAAVACSIALYEAGRQREIDEPLRS
ncbi:MAG: RNA methyltransferase [Bryobacteraceae bacterium]